MERKKSVNFSAFTIQPFNPVGFGDGWKNDNDECYNMTGKDFMQCLTRAAYNIDDIFISNYLHIPKENYFITPPKYSFNVTPFYVQEWKGIGFSVNMHSGEFSTHYSMGIELNWTLSYNIFITDKNLQPLNDSPDPFPRIMMPLRKNAGDLSMVLKVYIHNCIDIDYRYDSRFLLLYRLYAMIN